MIEVDLIHFLKYNHNISLTLHSLQAINPQVIAHFFKNKFSTDSLHDLLHNKKRLHSVISTVGRNTVTPAMRSIPEPLHRLERHTQTSVPPFSVHPSSRFAGVQSLVTSSNKQNILNITITSG